jgi:DNA-binding MarR family transcriptional regulator
VSEPQVVQREAGESDVDAVLETCRALVAVSAQSIAAVEDVVDVTQFRLLVVVGSRGAVSLRTLATAAGIHMSKASRMCERMVTNGLLNRADNPEDRRHLTLTLTPKSRRVLRKVMSRRRQTVAAILARMVPGDRDQLSAVLTAFADAAGEPRETDVWALGWTT